MQITAHRGILFGDGWIINTILLLSINFLNTVCSALSLSHAVANKPNTELKVGNSLQSAHKRTLL